MSHATFFADRSLDCPEEICCPRFRDDPEIVTATFSAPSGNLKLAPGAIFPFSTVLFQSGLFVLSTSLLTHGQVTIGERGVYQLSYAVSTTPSGLGPMPVSLSLRVNGVVIATQTGLTGRVLTDVVTISLQSGEVVDLFVPLSSNVMLIHFHTTPDLVLTRL